jgi:lipid-binding SYLF domain-containing protein
MIGMVRVWALAAALGVAAVAATVPAGAARAAAAEVIDAKVDIALNSLLAESPAAQAIAEKAVAVLVFPEIIKGGLGFGGQYGEGALRYLDQSKGFEVGADANVAVINQGMAVDATSTTIQDPIVGFAFGQKGLMAGATVEGSKITKINPK